MKTVYYTSGRQFGKTAMTNKLIEKRYQSGPSVGKSKWPGGDCFVPADTGLRSGEKFTITGIQRRKDGTITRNCKPGEETTFVAKIDV